MADIEADQLGEAKTRRVEELHDRLVAHIERCVRAKTQQPRHLIRIEPVRHALPLLPRLPGDGGICLQQRFANEKMEEAAKRAQAPLHRSRGRTAPKLGSRKQAHVLTIDASPIVDAMLRAVSDEAVEIAFVVRVRVRRKTALSRQMRQEASGPFESGSVHKGVETLTQGRGAWGSGNKLARTTPSSGPSARPRTPYPYPALDRPDRLAHEIADARQELRAHCRMETLGIGAADCEQTEAGLGSERHEGDGADLDIVRTEQEIALTVTDLSAARAAGFEQRVEHLELRRAALDDSQVPARDAFELGLVGRVEHHEPLGGAEVLP